jgi:hypothetical protein
MNMQNNRVSMPGQAQAQQPQQWTGAQRDNVGMGQMNQGQQNFPNSNLTNQAGFNQSFGNQISTPGAQQSNMGPMTHQMGAIQARLNNGTVPVDQDPNVKLNFFKVLQAAGLEGNVFVAGHTVDLWALYCLVKRFNPAQMVSNIICRRIGDDSYKSRP